MDGKFYPATPTWTGSTMRGSASASSVLLLLLAWHVALPGYAGDAKIIVENAQLLNKGQTYVLDADLSYRLPPQVLKTVQNGIPLVWELRVQIFRQHKYLWDDAIADLRQRYLIRYHALRNMYEVRDEGRGEGNYFLTLPSALYAIGTIRDLALPELQALDADGLYYARIKMQLDREALPLPMRPLAYINSVWYLSSGWYSWPVKK